MMMASHVRLMRRLPHGVYHATIVASREAPELHCSVPSHWSDSPIVLRENGSFDHCMTTEDVFVW